ncbi:MAG: diguanylate cyclase [Geminocystis sp.]|nr:diguanylate cyclase [Geminocystis sp.]HIK37778.1 diguanylate cyclase [Geminocystis sp. M7585_C2015_104]MCS7149086.1 diguanylate cyclase [Geminocystis sp.]MCX8079576.1 diguanylate cyclase [Geminocystis sp.]MDW8114858.1 diguanylate cyclase [Geminocystis sp.]
MKPRVVILDSREEERNFISNLLKNANYKVTVAHSELELFDLINIKCPDLVLISNHIPHKDAYLICKKIKILKNGENLPVIIINTGGELDIENVFNSGGSDYINAPFSPSEVLCKINHHLEIQRLRKEVEEKSNQLAKIIPHYQRLKTVLEKTKMELESLNKKREDKLLGEKDCLLRILEQEWLRGARQRASLGDSVDTSISLILAQINDFPAYRENHEEQMVSNCIELVGKTIKTTVKRAGDLVCTLEEGEFAILLPNTDSYGATTVAERINNTMAELQIPHHYSEISEYLSLSCGIGTGIPSQALPATVLLEAAKRALQEAVKSKKPNMIVVDHI